MGTPREYGFNDILKENILKADPVSFSAFVLSFTVAPCLAGMLISVRERRGGGGAMTQV